MLIHIGYHKTGTSWMQEFLFREENGFKILMSHDEVHKEITSIDMLDFIPRKDEIKEKALIKIKSVPQELTPVISSEFISGSPYMGGRNSYENLIKIKNTFPEAKILITIREQHSFISSIYNQWVKTGGTGSFGKFTKERNSIETYHFSGAHFAYHRLIELYIREFKKENVLVIPYEIYKKNKSPLISEISKFLEKELTNEQISSIEKSDAPVNRSLSTSSILLSRTINKLFETDNNPYGAINNNKLRRIIIRATKAIPVKKEKPHKTMQSFAESNRETQRHCTYDLKSLGYEI